MRFEQDVIETVTDTQVDAVRVTITLNQLQKINTKNGDTLGTSVKLKISLEYFNGTDGIRNRMATLLSQIKSAVVQKTGIRRTICSH